MGQHPLYQCGVRRKVLIVQDVGHEGHIVGPAESILVEIAREQVNPRFQPCLFHRSFRQSKRCRQIEHRSGQLRIGLAEGNRVGPGSSAQIQEPNRPAQLQPLGEIRPALLPNSMKDCQYIGAQLRICLEDMPVDRSLPGANRLLQLAPVLPFRIVQQEQVTDIFGRIADQMRSSGSRISVRIPVLIQESHRDESI